MDLVEKYSYNVNRHPWELSRATSILRILGGNPLDTQYADIGSGDMFFSNQLKRYTNKSIYAVDCNFICFDKNQSIKQCKEITDIPKGIIDCVILMDVLEHVDDEDSFLNAVLETLKNNGEIIVTVPAHQFLFSSHDIFLRHYRRYNRKSILTLFKKHNILVSEDFHFYSSLFICRCIQKLVKKLGFKKEKEIGIGNWRYKERDFITQFISNILNLDFIINRFLGKIGIKIWGLSLCLICRKKSY